MPCETEAPPLHLAILHIAHVFGGAERTTGNLLEGLDRRRFGKITLIAPAALRSYYPSCDEFFDLSPYSIGGWFSTLKALLHDARQIAKILDTIRPDIALGIMHYPSALLVFSRLFGARLPVVTSFRGPLYEHMRHYEPSIWRRLLLTFLTTFSARFSDLSIVPSTGTREELIRRFHAPADRVLVVPNGIDTDQVALYSNEPLAESETPPMHFRPLLCAVARLSAEKNLSLLLHAFALARQQHDAFLLVVGDGDQRADLEQLATKLGVREQVFFSGAKRNIFPFLARADIFIHTCLYEGFGYTMLEAMACGVPVIATDCPYGPREVIGDDKSGCLTPPQDAQAMAKTIIRLLCNPAERIHLAEKGHQRACELSISNMTKGFGAGLYLAYQKYHARRALFSPWFHL